MDTRDQTLTKLTRLHGKSHPTHHCPASLWWDYSRTAVSIMKLVMEDGWWWRCRRIRLSEALNGLQICPPREEQGMAAAPYRKTRWILLSDFSPRKWIYGVGVEVGGGPGDPRGRGRALGGALHPRGQGVGPLLLILSPIVFINSKTWLREVSGHSENFYFCTKITPWQFCWKQRQSGLVPSKSCKLESKTRAKEFGKVDT